MLAGEKMNALGRRSFLKKSGALVAVAALARGRLVSAAEPDAAGLVTGKDPRLLVHTAQPPVFETPAALLADAQVTPTPLFFVRNCQPTPKIAADDPLVDWKIELAGLVNKSRTIDAAALRKLPATAVEMVVQCSGNGRSLFSQSAATEGTQWGRGGMGNVRFGGVRLATLFDHLGVKPFGNAKFLTAAGSDEPKPGEMDFEHSLPLAESLNRSILALSLNGQPLPVIHGGPVRLVTPGYYGTMHVKWLTRMSFDAKESNHTSHIPHYRTPIEPIKPGSEFEPTYDNSEANWRMRLKSVVLAPESGATLAGNVTVVGVAFNDGEARIESVLVSVDKGQTWRPAQLEVPKSPYAWYRWRAELKLPPGAHQIWSRAVDALGRSQPLDGSIYWNPRGYTWNGVEKIDVTVA
jgi:DMSO/TMAO reductase YedYZ molybdopterin-dependent catalytic subunit